MESETAPKHPIQVVSRRTGLSPDLIRVWERRYRAVSPSRSETNRRLYSDSDVERLRLLRRATLAGRRIGDVAGLSSEDLRELTAADQAAEASIPNPAPREGGDTVVDTHLSACLEAVEALDPDRMQMALSNAAVTLTTPVLMEGLLMPLLHRVGQRWREGTLRVAHEHMASAIVRSFLGALKTSQPRSSGAPDLIVATPAGQNHELGALMVAVTASLDGWSVTYLGASLPAEDIAASVRDRRSRAVALSLVYPADDPRLPTELQRLRSLVPEEVPIIVGGAASRAYESALQGIGAKIREDMGGLRRELESLRYSA